MTDDYDRALLKLSTELFNGLAISSFAVGFITTALNTPDLFAEQVNFVKTFYPVVLGTVFMFIFHWFARSAVKRHYRK